MQGAGGAEKQRYAASPAPPAARFTIAKLFRVSRRRVMIIADIVRAAIVCSMVLVRSASTVWLVYPLLLLETIMAAFFEPARNAVIPNITAPEDVIVANTLGSTTWSMNLVMGALSAKPASREELADIRKMIDKFAKEKGRA